MSPNSGYLFPKPEMEFAVPHVAGRPTKIDTMSDVTTIARQA
ncbi:hypothetical protein [Bremerella alba]|uniref:Uncharacterized protein n=1 Tax=Bremerella alba TaxID=980252 RepID=A0A7V8V7L9_9BACT|nr:hypothetical protein [Bremerella alba]MBA2116400.1 hypothetical protein [Bremerella alba]